VVSKFLRFVAVPAAIVVLACKMWAGVPASGSPDIASQDILNRYIQAERTDREALRGASMDVDIDASIPKLKQQGRLHALRRISQLGTVTYHAITFQGDNSIKHQVIARYLDAERQAQSAQNLAITTENYKFKFKGERATANDARVYVFELTPRHRRVGLFKGDMWLDSKTYLPVYEKGRLVKNPSIFFKKVEFERAYSVATGVPVPVRTASVIKTRLVGNIELNVSYSNFALETADSDASDAEESAASGTFDLSHAASPTAIASGPYAPRE
jgi:hypothetical protein